MYCIRGFALSMILTEDKKEELKEILTEEEFLSLWENPKEKKKIRFGFKWF